MYKDIDWAVLLMWSMLAFLLPTSWAVAQEVALADVVTMALTSDQRISAARAALNGTQETRIEARSYRLPKLNAIGEVSTKKIGRFNSEGLEQQEGERFFGGVEITQDLYTFGRDRALSDRSKAQISVSGLKLARTTQDVALEVTLAFYDALEADQLSQAHERHAEDLGELLKATQAQFEQDLVTGADLALIRSRARQAEARKITADARFQVRLETLRTLANSPDLLPDDAGLEIYRTALPFSLQEAVGQSQLYSSEIRIAESEELSSRADLGVRKSDLYPKLVARGSWVTGQVGDTSSNESEVGLSVKMPLFDGGLKRSWVRRAKHDVSRAKAVLADVNRQKRDGIQISWTEFRSSQSVAESWIAALAAERLSLEGINENVKEDLVSIIYLLEARDEMVEVEVTAVSSRFDVHRKAFLLLHEIGSILHPFE